MVISLRLVPVMLALCWAAVWLAGAAPIQAQSQCTLNSFEQEVLTLLNNERTARGLSPVRIDCRLMQAAYDHNEAMAQAIQISHRLPGERPLIAPGPDNDRYDAVGYAWTMGGENVAVGQDTPTEVMAAWMASTGHRNNILASVYRDVGLAYKRDAGNNPWWTQDFGTATDSPPAPSQNPRSTGVFRTTNGYLYMKQRNDSGIADMWLHYGVAGDKPVAGDWNGDGADTIGIFRNGVFYLRNSNTSGIADIVFSFGAATDLPVVGDWDGDGTDTIGVYRNGAFFLRNTNASGPPDITLNLGIAGDVPIAGDWNADGFDTLGVFRPSNGYVYLRNKNTSGIADLFFVYGLAGDKPVAGDWNGDTIDSIGIYRKGSFYLRNSNTAGNADTVFSLGIDGDDPFVGDWDGLP